MISSSAPLASYPGADGDRNLKRIEVSSSAVVAPTMTQYFFPADGTYIFTEVKKMSVMSRLPTNTRQSNEVINDHQGCARIDLLT